MEQKKDYGSEDVKKELVSCLSGEVKAVARVCTDIVSWTGSVSQAAWSSPHKDVSIVSYLERPSGTAVLQYVPALEQTLDIVNIFLKLIISYLNQMPAVMEAFKGSEMSTATKRITLPSLVWMLWSRIRFVNDELYRNLTTQIIQNLGKEEKETQTEGKSYKSCDSCEMAKGLIIKLVEMIEKINVRCNIKECNVLQLRNQMSMDLLYLTQWGAMAKWIDAIMHDFDELGKYACHISCQNRKEQAKVKQLKQDVSHYELLMAKQDSDIKKFKTDIDKALESKTNCLKKISDITIKLKHKSSHCENMEKQIDTLEATVSSLKRELSDTKHSSIKDKEKYNNLMQEMQMKISQLEKAEQEIEQQKQNHKTELYELKNHLDLQAVTISSNQNEIATLTSKLEEAKRKEDSMNDQIMKEKSHGLVMWKNYEELSEKKILQDKIIEEQSNKIAEMSAKIEKLSKELFVAKENNYIPITGDPIKDMECQKRENENIIRRLSKHNMEINATLSKLYSHSVPTLST